MYAEIVAAVQSAKTLSELVKSAHSLSNHTQMLAAVHAVQEKLGDAITAHLSSQEKQSALSERVRELEEQVNEVENWRGQMQRYALFEFPTKALAYALKPGMEQGEPLHYLCTSCVDKKQKSTLQPNGRLLHCPACKTTIAMQKASPMPARNLGGSWMSS